MEVISCYTLSMINVQHELFLESDDPTRSNTPIKRGGNNYFEVPVHTPVIFRWVVFYIDSRFFCLVPLVYVDSLLYFFVLFQ